MLRPHSLHLQFNFEIKWFFLHRIHFPITISFAQAGVCVVCEAITKQEQWMTLHSQLESCPPPRMAPVINRPGNREAERDATATTSATIKWIKWMNYLYFEWLMLYFSNRKSTEQIHSTSLPNPLCPALASSRPRIVFNHMCVPLCVIILNICTPSFFIRFILYSRSLCLLSLPAFIVQRRIFLLFF